MSSKRGLSAIDFIEHADFDEFEAYWNDDLAETERLNSPWISNAYTNLARAQLWRGDWDQADRLARQATELEPPGMTYGFDWSMLFLVLAHRGKGEEALTLLEKERDSLPQAGARSRIGNWVALQNVVEGLALLDERQACADLLPQAQDMIATGMVYSWTFSLSQTTAAICATQAGLFDDAEQHFEQALADCTKLGFDFGAFDVHYWYARLLLHRAGAGDADRAHESADKAIVGFSQFGMRKHVELAQALLD